MRRVLKLSSAIVFALLVVAVTPVEASHFRGAVITVKDAPGGGQAFDASILVRFTARRSYYGAPNVGDVVTFATLFDFGDGSGSVDVDLRVIAIDTVNDVVTGFLELPGTTTPGELRHTYSGPGPWTAFIDDCCRVSSDPLNADIAFRVEATFDINSPNRCPVVNAPANVDVAPGTTLSFKLPASDQDNDPLAYRFTTSAENGGIIQPPGMTINASTGIINWPVPAAQTPGTYTGSFAVTDGVCKMAVDMTFTVRSGAVVNQPPSFNSPGVCGQTMNATAGVPVSFTVQASDPDVADTVSLTNNGLPAGAVFTPTAGNPASATFTWTPSAAASGTTEIILLNATDQQSLSAIPCSVTIVVDGGGGGGCTNPPTVSSPRPRNGTQAVATRGQLQWAGSADSFKVYFGPGNAGCSMLAGTTTAHAFNYSGLNINASYSFRIEATRAGCSTVSTGCTSFTTGVPCNTSAPTPIAPVSGSSDIASPVTFRWTSEPGATSYTLYVSENNQIYRNAGTTSSSDLTIEVAPGPISWFVVATFGTCGTARSAFAAFNAVPGCGIVDTTQPRAVALIQSGQKYHVRWDKVANGDLYELDVANNPAFANADTIKTSDPVIEISQNVSKPTAIYYRVRVRNTRCDLLSANSEPVRVVVVPNDPPTLSSFTLSAEFGSTQPISQPVFLPLPTGPTTSATVTYQATTDRPWLSVSPSTGTLPATVIVTADPVGLQPGSTTGTLIVTIVTSETTASATTKTSTVPISISLATPVAPAPKTEPSPNSLIIPAVAHADGLNSVWRSDVRLANLTGVKNSYRLLLTITQPAGLIIREGNVDVLPGNTLALDDLVRNWFGFGPLGDGTNAVLEIRPDPALPKLSTIASSRTYNVTPAGTLGQFIPAVPYDRFINQTNTSLVLQPITQSALFRTNLGIVEASGKPVNVLARFFSASGTQIFSETFLMKGGDQLQLPAFLAQNNISVTDGWLDVSVASSTGGKVTAYASVVDNRTGDGSLVSAISTAEAAASRFVVAGVGKASGGGNNWQSDVTLLNRGTTPVDATLTFAAQGSSARPTATIRIEPLQNKVLADVVASVFGVGAAVGSLIIDTPATAPLIVEGRTFNNRAEGTVGQALPAFTAKDAVSLNGRALQILNIEESERYRSNLGVAEVSGRPVTVEVTGFGADALVSPVLTLNLGANEFVQLSSILRQLGFDRTYNGRVSVAVVGGAGSVAAYVSVVDNETDDPTYVPAQ